MYSDWNFHINKDANEASQIKEKQCNNHANSFFLNFTVNKPLVNSLLSLFSGVIFCICQRPLFGGKRKSILLCTVLNAIWNTFSFFWIRSRSSLNMYTFAKWYAAFRHITWQLILQATKSSCLTVLKFTPSVLLLRI